MLNLLIIKRRWTSCARRFKQSDKRAGQTNSSFRIVFNKARGALMAVSETTRSVQKRGSATVVAAAVAAAVAGFSGVASAGGAWGGCSECRG